jgi:hypothetical protein
MTPELAKMTSSSAKSGVMTSTRVSGKCRVTIASTVMAKAGIRTKGAPWQASSPKVSFRTCWPGSNRTSPQASWQPPGTWISEGAAVKAEDAAQAPIKGLHPVADAQGRHILPAGRGLDQGSGDKAGGDGQVLQPGRTRRDAGKGGGQFDDVLHEHGVVLRVCWFALSPVAPPLPCAQPAPEFCHFFDAHASR